MYLILFAVILFSVYLFPMKKKHGEKKNLFPPMFDFEQCIRKKKVVLNQIIFSDFISWSIELPLLFVLEKKFVGILRWLKTKKTATDFTVERGKHSHYTLKRWDFFLSPQKKGLFFCFITNKMKSSILSLTCCVQVILKVYQIYRQANRSLCDNGWPNKNSTNIEIFFFTK